MPPLQCRQSYTREEIIELSQSRPYIALLGFANHCSHDNSLLAQQIGHLLAVQGLGLAVGNSSGTFAYAIAAHQAAGGHCLSVLEPGILTTNPATLWHENQNEKHTEIARRVKAAIIIGGATGSQKLANKILKQRKPVVAIEGTGGMVTTNMNPLITLVKSCSEAIKACQ